MDYLLRDSLHLGIQYGRYDIDRIVNTICAVHSDSEEAPARVGVAEGGCTRPRAWSLPATTCSRRFIFTAPGSPTIIISPGRLRRTCQLNSFQSLDEGVEDYLKWDDRRVLGKIAAGEAGEHGERLATRNHFRTVYMTPEVPGTGRPYKAQGYEEALGELLTLEGAATKSWYKVDKTDIPVQMEFDAPRTLSEVSSPIANMQPNSQTLLYTKPEDARRRKRESKS